MKVLAAISIFALTAKYWFLGAPSANGGLAPRVLHASNVSDLGAMQYPGH